MIFVSLIFVIVLVLIDQAIKFFVMSNIDMYETFYTLKIGGHDLFSITHVRNEGAAWSILSGKTVLLVAIAAIAILVVLFLIASGRFKLKFEVIMLSFIMAGGIGNLIDRIKYKEVIDYIRTDFIDFPIFNFADICVVIGAVGFCIAYLIVDTLKDKKAKNSNVIGALGDVSTDAPKNEEVDILTELSNIDSKELKDMNNEES